MLSGRGLRTNSILGAILAENLPKMELVRVLGCIWAWITNGRRNSPNRGGYFGEKGVLFVFWDYLRIGFRTEGEIRQTVGC
jgi:hypothetical protein